MKYIQSIAITSFLFISLLLGVDIYDDVQHGADWAHVLWESIALSLSAATLTAYTLFYAREVVARQRASAATIQEITADRDRWREQSEEYLRGLGMAIEQQFRSWKLTAAEADIGLFMLKGFSHKEIAQLRNTSERTVRQQAAMVYAKAGLKNKSQLAAFFLEDLILPTQLQVAQEF